MERKRTPEEEAELQQLIEDANKPLPLVVDEMGRGESAASRGVSKGAALRHWANATIGAFERLSESGLSYEEIEANYDISFQTYQRALNYLETGRLLTEKDERIPLDREM